MSLEGLRVSATQGPSLVAAALLGRCPRCGKGKLFSGFLKMARSC